LVDSLQMRSK